MTQNVNPEVKTVILKVDEKEVRKATTRGIIIGAVIGGTIVAALKDDSSTVKEIGKTITTIATSYYGCKFIYNLLS